MASRNCFLILDEDSVYKTVLFTISVISSGILVPAAYILVWYEKFGSDKKRTLINKLAAAVCWNQMVFFSTVHLLYSVRFYLGPLRPFACFWMFVFRKTLLINTLFLLNALMCARYAFIFWLKNPAAFNDDFWIVFINLFTFGFSFISQFLRAIVPGNQLLEYNICTGEDPTPILPLPPFARGYIELLSTAFHILAYGRIVIYKVRKSHRVGPENHAKFVKNLTIADIEKQSLTNFSINFCCLLAIASGALIINLLQVKSCDDLLDIQTSYTLIFSYVIYPNIIVGSALAMFFARKRVILQTVFRELRGNCEFIFRNG